MHLLPLIAKTTHCKTKLSALAHQVSCCQRQPISHSGKINLPAFVGLYIPINNFITQYFQTILMDLVKELSQPKAYPHSVDTIKHITTAMSEVFLTGDFVYKICKDINLGFLDYSSPEKRMKEIEDQYALNYKLSPEIHLGISKITEKQGSLSIDGDGKVVDFALKLKQMPKSTWGDTVLKEGAMSDIQLAELARNIADYHQNADSGKGISCYGELETIKGNWDENFEQTQQSRDNLISITDFDLIQQKVNRFMELNDFLFKKRVIEDKVKRCHGDFHLGNVFIEGDSIHIFDAITFNKRFPCCDVASEVAFMMMDLEYHQKIEESQRFLLEYLIQTGDTEMLKLLDFYKCYRAYIRGKIAQMSMRDENDKKESDKAKAYFSLAAKYAEKL